MKYIYTFLVLLFFSFSYGQHGIGVPRLTGDDLSAANADYNATHEGTLVYVSTVASAINLTGKTINVDKVGYYLYDGAIWQHVSETSDKLEDWTFLVTNWTTKPTLNTTITGGKVYDYTLNGVTRYRFVPDTYDAAQDAFYENFDGTNLTNEITTRTKG